MIRIRSAGERGHADHGWLDTRHTFSFARYHDPEHMGFRSLRVLNEDRVAPAQGFGKHPHRDMEIVTYVLEGALEHGDSMGHRGVIRPGTVQRMSAGTGVVHSEMNASREAPVHLLQIWIEPETSGLEPGYEERSLDRERAAADWVVLASRDGRDGSVVIHQDAEIHVGLLGAGERRAYALEAGRGAWLQVTRGRMRLGDHELGPGDGAAIEDEPSVAVEGRESAEVLLFDLA